MPDVMLTLSVLVVVASVIKFLIDGLHLVAFGHTLDIGHTDPMSYGSLLAPVLGAHSFQSTRDNTINPLQKSGGTANVDNPDAN